MRWRAGVAAVALAMCAAACADAGGSAGSDSPDVDGAAGTPFAGQELDGSWLLLEGVATVDGYPITLTIDGTTVEGTSACNQYFGEVALDGAGIDVRQLGGTDMGCAPDVMDAEAAYIAALNGATMWSVEADTLTLSGPDATLVFVVDGPAPTAELVGTVWTLDTLVDGDTARTPLGDPALLLLNADGTFEGSTGCRTLVGRWVERGTQIDFPEMAADGDCSAELQQQDGLVVSVLGDGFRASTDNGLLTLVSVGNQSLVYRSDNGDLVVPPAGDEAAVDLVTTCGYAVLGSAQDPVLPDAPLSEVAAAALEPYLGVSEGEFGFFSQFEWFLADETDTTIVLFGFPYRQDDDGYADAQFELRDGVWEPTGWGTCHPRVNVAGEDATWGLATWILDPDNPPDPNATAIPVLINERSCAGGEAPVGREIVAQAVDQGDELVITVLVEPVPGFAACPSNPWYPTVIDVGEAPDGRTLLDGSTTPAEERGWPPSHPEYYEDE